MARGPFTVKEIYLHCSRDEVFEIDSELYEAMDYGDFENSIIRKKRSDDGHELSIGLNDAGDSKPGVVRILEDKFKANKLNLEDINFSVERLQKELNSIVSSAELPLTAGSAQNDMGFMLNFVA